MLQVRDLTVQYGRTSILQGASLSVSNGNTLVLLGSSGCGKTTLLRAIAGLIPCTSGDVLLDGRAVHQCPIQDRGIVYLDQEPLLFEHLNVAQNIGFALQNRRVSRADIDQQTGQMLSLLDLKDHAQKYDHQLSGGQKQRVAFARAILAKPRLLLLDEPFCSLDAKTRGQMQTLFAQLCAQFRLTSVFVTHDVKEAIIVGQQFGYVSEGRVRQYSDRQEFMNDEATGVPSEIRFWLSQNTENPSC
jgi:putrescine transport system ATP-binding protein